MAADSVGRAIDKFGLVGTWSTNCTRSTISDTLRTTYELPFFGPPKIKDVGARPRNGDPNGIRSNGVVTTREFEVEAAEQIADDKIQIIYSQTRFLLELDDGKVPIDSKERGQPIETVIQKVGNKIRTLSSVTKDGRSISARDGFQYEPILNAGKITSWMKTDKETPLRDKCLS